MQKLYYILALALLLINGVGALYGGYLLMTDPAGRSLQLPHEWIEHTPFKDFFIPGLILFFVNGVCSFIVIMLLLVKYSKIERFILAQGILLCGWIIIQLLLTLKYHPLQAMMGAVGLLLIVVAIRIRNGQYQAAHID